ncbi:MAG TPA: redox-regulated ATPase YchF [Candidatus Acidoferrales bacterium]|nr:redox-regulated ATPase YchF [Candidatus Acidoferrales bacterium]
MPRVVGVVGKPNVGKSTFFSAATLAHVAIANYPFTTIKPNVGMGYVRTPCVCREFNVTDTPGNSTCINGIRLIPVELVDCAGLVPGAWQGRGLGNQFLDEVRQADALVHIVDASGSTDAEGKLCDAGTHDPREDVQFLEHELDMWLLQIVKKEWARIIRLVEQTKEELIPLLEDKLSGLGIRRDHLAAARSKTGLNFEKPGSWSEDDLLRLVTELRARSKPLLIAANKMDVPPADKNLQGLTETKHMVVPCCAEAELALRRAAEKGMISYVPGDSNFKLNEKTSLTADQVNALNRIKDKVLVPLGSTGVQESLNLAFFKLLQMITVYPVEDPEKLTDHKGRILPDAYLVPFGTTAKQFAGMIHSDLAAGFLYATEARSKMRVGDDYVLKDRDVISIISAKRHA